MRYYHFFILILATVLGCNKDSKEEKAHLDINFKLVYDDSPLVFLENYHYPSGELMNFNRLSFYLSNLKISNGQNEISLLDIDYLNFRETNSSFTNAQKGLNLHFTDVPEGEYDKISFSFGVPADLNAKAPGDYPSSNPLSSPAEYWAPWRSYIFMKLEGQIDLNFDGEKEEPFAIHTGADQAFRTVELPINVSFAHDKNNEINIIIDVSKFFQGSGKVYDIRSGGQTHSELSLPYILQVCDNLVGAVRMQ